MKKKKKRYWLHDWRGASLFWLICLLIASIPSAWLTHVIWWVLTLASDDGATAGQIILGFAAIVVFPLGILHGYLIWILALLQ